MSALSRSDSHSSGRIAQLAQVSPAPISLEDNTGEAEQSLDSLQPADRNGPWCKECSLAEPSIISGTGGGKYTMWTVEFRTWLGTKVSIRKRYTDFVELRDALERRYSKQVYIQKLPSRTYFYQDRFDAGFLEKRRRALEYWLNSVVLNPTLSGSPEVKAFVLRKR